MREEQRDIITKDALSSDVKQTSIQCICKDLVHMYDDSWKILGIFQVDSTLPTKIDIHPCSIISLLKVFYVIAYIRKFLLPVVTYKLLRIFVY